MERLWKDFGEQDALDLFVLIKVTRSHLFPAAKWRRVWESNFSQAWR
jgi:hypothetical protein